MAAQAGLSPLTTVPNRDLQVGDGNQVHWCQADHRRHGWHNVHRIARHVSSFRAARTLPLEKRMDLRIAELKSVRLHTSLPWFSALVVIRAQHVLYERYAPDFNRDSTHSIQSITKTTLNLIVGQLVEQGILDLSQQIRHYIPEIGSGYGKATLQQVLNMDVVNDYSEDFTDATAAYYRHEEVMGWRLPRDPSDRETPRQFLSQILSSDPTNHSGLAQYKDANSDVIGWAAERASGRSLRSFIADIVDAAGLEGAFYITTDREGVPWLAGGACLTARDLARYFSLFIRRGVGVSGETVGSAKFIDQTLSAGIPMPPPYEGYRYCNQTMVSGPFLGHGGWGGQYAVAQLATGTIAVFFSVIEDQHAATRGYMLPIMRMLESITTLES